MTETSLCAPQNFGPSYGKNGDKEADHLISIQGWGIKTREETSHFIPVAMFSRAYSLLKIVYRLDICRLYDPLVAMVGHVARGVASAARFARGDFGWTSAAAKA